jgi:hypothetical protein
MHSKLNAAEREWIGMVKEQPCSVCGADGPSDAHHIKQRLHYTTVALCKSCHQGSKMGWHGEKAAWRIAKMDELDALNVTVGNISQALQGNVSVGLKLQRKKWNEGD